MFALFRFRVLARPEGERAGRVLRFRGTDPPEILPRTSSPPGSKQYVAVGVLTSRSAGNKLSASDIVYHNTTTSISDIESMLRAALDSKEPPSIEASSMSTS